MINENDPFPAAWLHNLWPCAVVDERSITDLEPGEIPSGRCHFFGGIGGWEYALELAGWPEDEPVWTGSCPCQPFSVAGKRKGVADEWWVAYATSTRAGEQGASVQDGYWTDDRISRPDGPTRTVRGMAYSESEQQHRSGNARRGRGQLADRSGLADTDGRITGDGRVQRGREHGQFSAHGATGGGLGHTERDGRRWEPEHADEQGARGLQLGRPSPRRQWYVAIWLPCGDGKARR